MARAVAEFDGGRWAEARSLFLRAHALWPSARTLRTLGMTSFELRNYAHALEELEASLRDERRPLPDDQRRQVAELVEETRAFVGRYRVRIVPDNAELLVDGAPHPLGPNRALVLEVGTHELVARAKGRTELRRRLDVQGRDDQDILLELEAAQLPTAAPPRVSERPDAPHEVARPQASGRGRVWTWVAGGTAVALGTASTVLWLVSDSKFQSLKERCASQSCTPANTDTSAIEATQTAHQVTLGLAIAAGASAIGLYFLEGGSERSTSVALGVGTVRISGHF